jgi:hypothetical protein
MAHDGANMEDIETFPSFAEIDAIGACPHPVLRNLRITQAYYELSTATARRIGAAANWCTFATWASKQAGQSIRGDDLGRKIEETFARSDAVQLAVARIRDLRRAAGRAVDDDASLAAIREACAPLLTVGRVSDAVARGNKKVFDEIGREFARFLGVIAKPGADSHAVEEFCAGLRPGDPPVGQRLLAEAFRDYYRAMTLTETKARAERMLLAALRVGLHEQTRLQPEIEEALNAPLPDPAELRRRLVQSLLHGIEGGIHGRVAESLTRLPHWHGVLDEVAEHLAERLRPLVRAVVTKELMTLTVDQTTLHLGSDLTGSFPALLATIADRELAEFVSRVDPTRDTLRGSGSRDWAALPGRMHFIADLFRLYLETPGLFRAPFTPEQLATIADGHTPDGQL